MSGSDIFRHAPDSASLLAKPIIRSGAKFGRTLSFVSFDHQPVFVATHYRHRQEPCLAPLGHFCAECDNGQSPREMAYIGGFHLQRKMRGCIELTARAAVALNDAANHGSLRGRHITISRAGDRANGEMLIELHDDRVDEEKLPTDWDTTGSLAATWRVDIHKHLPSPVDAPPDDPRVRGDYVADAFRQPSKNGSHT